MRWNGCPTRRPTTSGIPTRSLVVIGQFCAFDHWRQRIVLVDNVIVPGAAEGEVDDAAVGAAYEDACARLNELAADCAGGQGEPAHLVAVPPPGLERAEAARTMTAEHYRGAIGAAKEHITAGDIFQVVLSQRYDLRLEADPFDVYRALRLLNPSPYMYFLRFPEVTVVGASPEPLVRLREQGRRLAAHRWVAPSGRERAARPAARSGAGRGSQGVGRAHHAGGLGPQRRRPCRALWHRESGRADDH